MSVDLVKGINRRIKTTFALVVCILQILQITSNKISIVKPIAEQ